MTKKKIYAVGLGPGAADLITPRAEKILQECETISGYGTYLKQFPEMFEGKKIITTGMTGEVERCRLALEAAAAGERVAVISSGDAGVYGMAGLLMELIAEDEVFSDVEVEVIPGITAASAAAAILGAPLMNDFVVLSLSDLLTPREVIMQRVEAVAKADLVCALYNPASRKRRELITETAAVFRAERGDDVPVGVVHYAERPGQEAVLSTLGDIPFDSIAMNTVVIIGNSQTVVHNGKIVTLRGYTGFKE